MNCIECRDNLIACIEGLLGDEESSQCQAHLETCAACRAEYASFAKLQQQLVARGQAAADVSIVEPVMRRVRAVPGEPQRNTIMSILLKHRWGLGLGATAGAVAIIIVAALFTAPKIQAAAVEVMTKGAEAAAKLTTIHIRGQLRTAPNENFSYIDPDLDFVPVELWKQFGPELKWRVDKPGRLAVMDGQSTVLFIKPDFATKVGRSSSAFDTQWLHEMADVSQTLNNELSASKTHGWPVTLAQEQGTDGKPKSVVTVEASTGVLTGDYLKNKFFSTADTRRVYVFDDQSQLLESVKIYLHADSGEKLVFELDQIDYNQPIEAGVFQLQVPATVAWQQEMQMLPDNAKYAAMTSEQAARAFFEACGREDWNEAGKFCTMTGTIKDYLGGLEVINIGDSFTSSLSLISGARFVPYEIKLKNGEVKKWNLALKKDGRTSRWYVDGGI
jgi:outer membrane lipoprotein-sorting protein